MNIKAAAEFLGISVKSIERYVNAKKIAVTYVDGKRDFSQEELTRFKEQKQEPVYRPVLAATANDTALSQSVASEYLNEGLVCLEAIATSIQAITQHQLIHSKMLLNLKEAKIISGLSENLLNYHLKCGNLPGKKLGRGWKIRPPDLEEFVDALFKGSYDGR